MAKTYQKKNTKKTKIILSPHNAEKIIEAEFMDSKGGKHGFNAIFKPHLPNKGDMKLDYNVEKEGK